LALKQFEIQRALKASLAGSYGAVTTLDEFWAHRILSFAMVFALLTAPSSGIPGRGGWDYRRQARTP
jgi:hypothetical protein